jgi:uncharacterized protein YggU (UPF0235/DUF167 family)
VKINCKIITNSSQEKIIYLEDQNLYRIYVHVSPTDGKANKQIIELLADYFMVPKYKITIISGHTTTLKIIEIN